MNSQGTKTTVFDPNYRTVRLGFSKLLGTLICSKICIYLLRIHYKKNQKKDLFDDDYVIVSDFYRTCL